MKEWNNIEKQMKAVVNADTVAAPDFIWTAIEENLEPNKIKKSGWYTILALALALVAVAWLVSSSMNQNTSDNILSSYKSIGLVSDGNTAILTKEEDAVASTPMNVPEVNRQEGESVIMAINNSIEGENISKRSNFSDAKFPNAIVTTTDPKANLRKQWSGGITDVIASDKYTMSNEQKNNIANDQESTNTTNEVLNRSIVSGISNHEESSNTTSSSTTLGSRIPKSFLSITKLASLDLVGNFSGTERAQLGIKDKIECPSFSNNIKIHPFIELNGIIGRHMKGFRSIPSGEIESSALQNAREGSESSWYNWGGQFLVGLNINRNIYFGTGLEVSQSKDKFNHEVSGVTQLVINLDENGNPIDTSLVSGTFVSAGEVRYNMVDIPIFVGLTKSMGSWDVGIEAAALLNISFSATGKVLDESLEVSTLAETPLASREKIGMGLKGSIVVRKYISNGLSLHVKPTFKTYLGSVSQANYPLDTKLSFGRLDVGLKMDF